MKIEILKPKYLITTFFGSGYFPIASGTFASIVALIPLLLIDTDFHYLFFPISIIIAIISIPLIKKIEYEKGNDNSIIVIDEVIGIWLIFCSPIIYFNWINVIIGVVLFRFFDIVKPCIINKINSKQGPIYVLLDDIIAAFFTSIILHIINITTH
jgi:phosphatidylglycerophosphatase A